MMRPTAAYHRHHQRLGDVEKSINGYVDYPVPLFCAHAGEHGVVMDACIVDQNLDRLVFDEGGQHIGYRCAVSHIKYQHLRTTPIFTNGIGQRLCGLLSTIGMNINMAAIGSKTVANGRANAAAAAGNQGIFHGASPEMGVSRSALSTTAARPSSSRCPAALMLN